MVAGSEPEKGRTALGVASAPPDLDARAAWDPALRLLHAGTPLSRPERTELGGYDPTEAVTLDEIDVALAQRLRTLGYLTLRYLDT